MPLPTCQSTLDQYRNVHAIHMNSISTSNRSFPLKGSFNSITTSALKSLGAYCECRQQHLI